MGDTPETDELRRQWLADAASIAEHGSSAPGWRAFEAAMSLCAKMEIKARELEMQNLALTFDYDDQE